MKYTSVLRPHLYNSTQAISFNPDDCGVLVFMYMYVSFSTSFSIQNMDMKLIDSKVPEDVNTGFTRRMYIFQKGEGAKDATS